MNIPTCCGWLMLLSKTRDEAFCDLCSRTVSGEDMAANPSPHAPGGPSDRQLERLMLDLDKHDHDVSAPSRYRSTTDANGDIHINGVKVTNGPTVAAPHVPATAFDWQAIGLAPPDATWACQEIPGASPGYQQVVAGRVDKHASVGPERPVTYRSVTKEPASHPYPWVQPVWHWGVDLESPRTRTQPQRFVPSNGQLESWDAAIAKAKDSPALCSGCGSGLVFSARARGTGLCGPCSRSAAGPVDPLDVKHDGVSLRDLLETDRVANQELPGAFRRHFTPAQRAAVSAHWSTQLRAKVAATKAADAERERNRVTIDMEDD